MKRRWRKEELNKVGKLIVGKSCKALKNTNVTVIVKSEKGNYGFELSNDYLEVVLETLLWSLRLELGEGGYIRD